MKELNRYFKNEVRSIEGATIIYGAVKELKGINTSNTRNQITRNLRFIHAYWFFASFKSTNEILDWIIDNTFIVLRLKTEKDQIHKGSKYEQIKNLISE